ncbi:MAG TPA: tRNA pseudouridine(38-40) synthase TruA [Spirochaetaceae bacterium]|nr:tRNA pseudouridine(38-40) synthase TruA [Spirochaetaceae bacterium]
MRESWNRDVELAAPVPPFRRFQLIVSYYGPAHYGWQRQDSKSVEDKSVQCFIEKAIRRISGDAAAVYGSGRTDSGVHAIAQCAHFDSPSISMDEETLRRALNANLPNTIRINQVIERFDAFHARFSTLLREYEYIMKDDVRWMPFDEGRAWHLRRLPDAGVLNRMHRFLLGEDVDFTAFDFSKLDDGHSQKRDIFRSEFEMLPDRLVFAITGNAFLYHMVRSIVGTSVRLALKYPAEEAIRRFAAFFSKDSDGDAGLSRASAKAEMIAPAHGLYLKRIIYDESKYSSMRSLLSHGGLPERF